MYTYVYQVAYYTGMYCVKMPIIQYLVRSRVKHPKIMIYHMTVK